MRRRSCTANVKSVQGMPPLVVEEPQRVICALCGGGLFYGSLAAHASALSPNQSVRIAWRISAQRQANAAGTNRDKVDHAPALRFYSGRVTTIGWLAHALA